MYRPPSDRFLLHYVRRTSRVPHTHKTCSKFLWFLLRLHLSVRAAVSLQSKTGEPIFNLHATLVVRDLSHAYWLKWLNYKLDLKKLQQNSSRSTISWRLIQTNTLIVVHTVSEGKRKREREREREIDWLSLLSHDEPSAKKKYKW